MQGICMVRCLTLAGNEGAQQQGLKVQAIPWQWHIPTEASQYTELGILLLWVQDQQHTAAAMVNLKLYWHRCRDNTHL